MEYENENSTYDEEGTEADDFNLIDYFLSNGEQYFPKPNIADMLTQDQLMSIGRRVCEGESDDKQSMADWVKGTQAGLDLLVQETEPRSTPWEGACNYKSPTLGKSCLEFSDRACTELMRQKDLVMVNVVGDDPDEAKQKRADRVAVYENYQINERMEEWRDEHEKMIYLLSPNGTVFKKIYFDPVLGRNVCDLVTYPNFTVDNTCTSLSRLRRFSEKFTLPKNTVMEKVNAGVWVDNGIVFGSSDQSEANPNAEQPADSEQDDMTTFIEQQCWYDCDNDGYEEPYTVVVQELTQKVVRITPRYELNGIYVKADGKIVTADKTSGHYDSVVRIQPNTSLVMYGMLHDPQGGLLYQGYGHILCAITQAINTTTNQLIDSASLATNACGWLAKGFRKKLGDIGFAPGEFKSTGLSAAEMKDGILMHPSKEPSGVLYQLRNDLIGASDQYSASVDLKDAIGANAPAETTLGIIHEKQLPVGAIILRIYRTMAKEFKILFDLDSKFLDVNEYMEVVDDKEATAQDFTLKGLDIIPSANPEISSRIMRIQQANAEMANIEVVAANGGDIRPIIKGYYEAIGCSYTDEIFTDLPPEKQLEELMKQYPELNDLVMATREQNKMITEQQLETNKAQNAVLSAQANKLGAEAKRIEAEANAAPYKQAAEIANTVADTRKANADAVHSLELAHDKGVAHAVALDSYAASLDSIENAPIDISATT